MKKEYTVIIEQDEDGYYMADLPELYCYHTQAKSLDVTTLNRMRRLV
ncbi:MAG: type II toxin-antitoxin system HicB family antitoxin [Deltaproteobacteria bacterium]